MKIRARTKALVALFCCIMPVGTFQDSMLLIGGHPRSGTRLLWQLVNSHPSVHLTYEFLNFADLEHNYSLTLIKRLLKERFFASKTLFSPAKYPARNSLHRITRKPAFLLNYLYATASYKTAIEPENIEQFLLRAFPGAKIVGDKHPHYVFMLDSLVKMKNLACLIIYRDCRDVASSMLQKIRTRWLGQAWTTEFDTAEKIASKWVNAVENMERCAHSIKVLRYENLVTNTAKEMDEIGKWLGLEFAPETSALVHHASIGKYKDGLTAAESDQIDKIAGPTLARLGYI